MELRPAHELPPAVALSPRRRRCRSHRVPSSAAVAVQVLPTSHTGQAHPLLRIRAPLPTADAAAPGDADPLLGLKQREPQLQDASSDSSSDDETAAYEEHLVPYVPPIVAGVDVAGGKVVYLRLPAGLLNLGWQQQLLTNLR